MSEGNAQLGEEGLESKWTHGLRVVVARHLEVVDSREKPISSGRGLPLTRHIAARVMSESLDLLVGEAIEHDVDARVFGHLDCKVKKGRRLSA